MRETNSNGQEVISLPHDLVVACNKLGTLGSVGAKRQWETAALVAMICESKGRGRPRKTTTESSFKRLSIADLARKGIYGLQSQDSIRAYLKAWELTGQEAPAPGQKVTLPDDDFPDYADLYGRSPENVAEPLESGDAGEYTPEAAEAAEDGSPPRAARQREAARSMLDEFLRLLDKMDPSAVIHGQSPDRKELLIKTLESWLESLRETEGLD